MHLELTPAPAQVMYYSGTIVTMAGWTDVSDAIWITAAISFVGFVFCIVGMSQVQPHLPAMSPACAPPATTQILTGPALPPSPQVERRGRRCLVLTSLAGVAVSLACLGLAFYMLRSTSDKARPAVPGTRRAALSGRHASLSSQIS